ncbi:MAG TPA: mechanosensitive ion channel domain-containing protein [Burkholderiaceae bacterium]|nr:mechanosensitive ion channel domain-containing protein [Burkholderiaceae bacterium]
MLQRQLQTVKDRMTFTEADLEQIGRSEQARQARFDKAAAAAQTAADQRTREAAAAERALQALRVAVPAASPARLNAAEAQLRALSAAVDTARRESETQAALSRLSAAMVEMWQARFDALNAPDAARRQAAADALRDLHRGLSTWRTVARGQIETVQADQAEQAAQQERAASEPDVLRYESARADALSQRALRAQQLVDEIERIDRTLRRWLTDIGQDRAQRPWQDQAAALGARALAVLKAVWGFELFAVEDSVEVQGQKITTKRGVTVGKSIGALLIFLVGYWLTSKLARRLERTLTARFGIDARQARTIRRWTMTAFGFVLLVLVLNLAQIPLTVFAFFGGALAIGVGFGTQTIIKNFISGLILLMERQVQVGDAVEIDGFSGTVAEINLRSSTIAGYDGVDAIVPNSTLLESRVSNWTMGNRRVRRVVRVGVAYGSPTRQVADLIRACAERHGEVLKQPPPQVLLEDFGDNALTFALFIWIDIRSGAGGPAITSDLRFMIEAALADAGISIAFPQRDIHLDTTRPLQVRIARERAGG